MADPWDALAAAAGDSLNVLWCGFAKQGRESAVFAPLAKYPHAAAWLAESMACDSDHIVRKLGAMLGGWVQHEEYLDLLSDMLARERRVFTEDSLSANAVGEDIMFAATRWSQSAGEAIRARGTEVLATMIRDCLASIPWNTANCAAANLYQATEGAHPVLGDLVNATPDQLDGQEFLQAVVTALKENDQEGVRGWFAPPSPLEVLPPTDPHYSVALSLWQAAASAEASLQ